MIDVEIRGDRIPALGFGTWPMPGAECRFEPGDEEMDRIHGLERRERLVDPQGSFDRER